MPNVFDFRDPTTAATCCHEAGHFVAAAILSLPCESIVLYDRHSGVMSHPGSLYSEFDEDEWDRFMAPVALAGPVAECFARRQRQHNNLAIARLPARRDFWRFALSLPTPRGVNVDLERTAIYCRQGARSAHYARQRAKKLLTKVHAAITNADVWKVVRDVAERLAKRGCLVDDELAPYADAAQAAGRRWQLLTNL
jgi:hypothetical protein